MNDEVAAPRMTDPAKELYELCKLVGAHKGNPSNINTGQALPAALGCARTSKGAQPATGAFYELVAVIKYRFESLAELAAKTENPNVDDEVCIEGLAAIKEVSGFLQPGVWSQTWQPTAESIGNKSSLRALLGLSSLVRPVRPLRLLSPEEIKTQIQTVRDLLSKLTLATDMPPWTKQAIEDGLNRLLLVLERLPFFGVEMLMEATLQTAERISAGEMQCHNIETSGSVSSDWFDSASKALIGITTALTIYGYVSDTLEITGWTYKAIEWIRDGGLPALSAPLKQLPPPSGSPDGTIV